MVNKDTKMAAPRGGGDVCPVCEVHGTGEHGHTTLDICNREREGVPCFEKSVCGSASLLKSKSVRDATRRSSTIKEGKKSKIFKTYKRTLTGKEG